MTLSVRRLALQALAAGLLAAPLFAEVVVTTMPSGMLQLPGQETATDFFVLTNTASPPAAVSLTTTGGFFSISRSSFVLASGEMVAIEIHARAMPASVYTGSVIVSSSGQDDVSVPVTLLVTDPPSQRVAVRPAEPRVLVDPLPPLISPSLPPDPAMLTFMNPSAVAVTALVVSDAGWLVPLQNSVVLPAGGSASIYARVDRERRPDAANPIGSLSANVSLRFFSGPQTTSAPPTAQLSTVVVDVNKAHVVIGSPPPLALSDIAFFVGRYGGGVDLSLFARSDAPHIRDLRLFFERLGMSSFAQLPASTGLSFVDFAGSAGSVQIRTPDAALLNLAAVKTTVTGGHAYGSVLPILTSSQGTLPGGRIYLPGVAKDSATRTDLYLQEVSGNGVSIRLEFLDRNGAVVSNETRTLEGFASAYVQDAVPAGTFTVLISNDESSGGRIGAVAVVTDLATGDVWPIRAGGTGAAAAGEPLFIPSGAELGGVASEVHVVNRGSDVALVQLETVRGTEPRRRAVRRGPSSETVAPIPLAQNSGTTFRFAGAYARLSSTGGLLVASGRTLGAAAAGGSYGSALPVVSQSSVLRAGSSRSFAGIEDAAASTVAASTPLTFRSKLTLLETARADATVRLTLHYTVSTGLAWGRHVRSRDVVVRAGKLIVLEPLARAIIGADRDFLGDLRNLILIVEVVSGSGEIIPVVTSVENESGDITVRGQ